MFAEGYFVKGQLAIILDLRDLFEQLFYLQPLLVLDRLPQELLQ